MEDIFIVFKISIENNVIEFTYISTYPKHDTAKNCVKEIKETDVYHGDKFIILPV